MNWFEAEEACNRHGGHLASVTNQAVHNYIKGKPIQAWIGGTNKNEAGTWLWTDCSDWDFNSGWNWGEPNNWQGKAENCAEYSNYGYGYMDMGGMTNPATQNKDLFAAKQFVQVRK